MTTREEISEEYEKAKNETDFGNSRCRDEFKIVQNEVIIELLLDIKEVLEK